MIFKKNGLRESEFRFDQEEQKLLVEDWKSFASKIKKYPRNKFSGRGLVFTAGGISYITCAWVSISVLRDHGCKLPIELWHKNNEVSLAVIERFKSLNVEFKNFDELGQVTLFGYMLKPLAILGSSFSEILYMDADNICTKDPSYLFETKEYKDYGAVFWPDYWHTSKKNPIWEIIGTKRYDIPEQESGQIVINKARCWKELNLCLYFNQMSDYYYKIILGDKDTFKFAWLALRTDFFMIKNMPGTCGFVKDGRFFGNTMVQHDTYNDIIFLHRNLLKWDITRENEMVWSKIKSFKTQTHRKIIIYQQFATIGLYIDLDGDFEELDFKEIFGDFELKCHNYLNEWRRSADCLNFFNYLHIIKNRIS